jgi:hypothetical protein
MGSGNLITRAIQKYGVENFSKEILHVFSTEEEMNQKEKELVVVSEETYNLCEGGKGGFGYINANKLSYPVSKLNKARLAKLQANSEFREIMSNAAKKASKASWKTLSKWTEEERKLYFTSKSFLGKHHTEETKRKISEANKINQKGHRNSQYGKPRSAETKKKISETLKKKKIEASL